MTFLDDIWKKFKTQGPHPEKKEKNKASLEIEEASLAVLESKVSAAAPISNPFEKMQKTLDAFEKTEVEGLQNDKVFSNLRALKEIVDQPKEHKPEKLDLRFSKINQHLGEAESHETVRQDRWPDHIKCPECSSTNLKRLPQTPPASSHNHRYRCLNCGHIFNDDSGTPLEGGIPPLNVWMQCWYLMGCTDSLNYIAVKLGLSVGIVEFMSRELQKIFNAKKPLTRFLSFEEWNKQSQNLRDQLQEDLLKQYERLNANIATVPKDSAEFRRQQNLRRDLDSSTAPPSSGRKR